MKYCMIFITGLLVQQVKSQTIDTVSKDTIVYRSEIIRNNLIGQDLLFKTETGSMYRLLQDGMPCFAPAKPEAAKIPNAFIRVKPIVAAEAMPGVKPRALPEYKAPKKAF